jgi:WD40 repeat protein
MIIGEPTSKTLPYNIDKKCNGLKIDKVIAFKGIH